MLIAKQMERLWEARKFDKLLDGLLESRVEAMAGNILRAHACLSSAAMALIRIEEIHQVQMSVCPRLIRAILAHQHPDGTWGDLMLDALCIRALSITNGAGEAIDRAIANIARLQQPGGIWPNVPIRRMPEDATVSAFILLELAASEAFRQAVNVNAAVAWFQTHLTQCDPTARMLWSHARLSLNPARIAAPTLWQAIN